MRLVPSAAPLLCIGLLSCARGRAGLVCLELFKVFQGKDIEAYRNTFANLALPLFAMAEPIPPKTVEFNGMKWTLWDRWILSGDLTVQEVIDWFQVPAASATRRFVLSRCSCRNLFSNLRPALPQERKLTAYSISGGPSLLYNNFFPKHRERLDKKLSELMRTVAKLVLPLSPSPWVPRNNQLCLQCLTGGHVCGRKSAMTASCLT